MAGDRAAAGRRRFARFAGVGLVMLCVLVLAGSSAAQTNLTPTDQPLPGGSQFQGGDGNQDNAPGLIDWQGLEANGEVGHTSDPQHPDNVFTGGSKELEPDGWGLTTQNNGSSPSSGNILDFYYSVEHPPGADTFLYLGFTREASNGNVYVTFELNQDSRLWRNGDGAMIPCRKTGDILIQFEPHGNGATIEVDRWVTDTTDAASGCAKTGHLVSANLPSSVVQGAFNASTISNYLPGFYGPGSGTIPSGNFGEAAINLSAVLSDLGNPCGDFASAWMHSRSSSSSESAELQDYVAPAGIDVHTCKASPTLTSQASGPINHFGHLRRPHVKAGSGLTDTALLSGGRNPTGTITFHLYGPHDPTCSGTPIFRSSAGVAGNGYYTSGEYAPTVAGTYRWRVHYSGDDNNDRAGPTACGDATETGVVNPAHPELTSAASGLGPAHRRPAGSRTARAPQPIHDAATISGGLSPTGTVTFDLHGPHDRTCTETPISSSTVPVNGNGTYISDEFTPDTAGTYRWVVNYSGDANNHPAGPTDCGIDTETITIDLAHPALTTVASGSTDLGSPIHDSAILSGGADPTGTIDFHLYGPDDGNCTGPPADSSSVNVSGNGTYDSPPFTPTIAGTYRWVASYSGDGNNAPVATSCSDPAETVVVAHPTAHPSLTTTASPSAPAGSPVHDIAHLSGGSDPTGTITFEVFGPDGGCVGSPVDISTVAVDHGNGDYPSAPFTPTKAGTYRWIVSYSGDDRNFGAGPIACDESAEHVVITRARPAVTTVASPGLAVGQPISDSAFLNGGSDPSGTITFRLYGPNNPTCSTPAVFNARLNVTGNGLYQSPKFVPQQAGTYLWQVFYSGDANNQRARSGCGADHESAVVHPRHPHLITTASPPATRGHSKRVRSAGLSIYDTAILGDGWLPTGEISFALYGPGDSTCSRSPVFTTATTVSGNGTYNSQSFIATVSGTYTWRAMYSGDPNNHPSGPTACGATAETVDVIVPADPALTTSASQAVELGGAVHDTAHLSGGENPTGTIIFRLYPPQDTGCSGNAEFTSVVPVHGNGDYDSAPYTPTIAGAYRWTADYTGDAANNTAGPTVCGDSAELAFVRPPAITPVTPGFSTTASGSSGVGAPIHDVAHLTGALDPAGAITFELFGPDDATCKGRPVFTSTAAVTGNGDFGSASFIPTVAGTYRWVATYSGDANNIGVGPTGCGVSGETVIVNPVLGPNIDPGPKPKPPKPPQPPRPKPKPKSRPPIVIPIGRG